MFTKPPGEDGRPPKEIKESESSSVAAQKTSSNSRFGKWLDQFMQFIWPAVSFKFKEATFSDWQTKKEISKNLAQTMADRIEAGTKQQFADEAKKVVFKQFNALFDNLSLEQLNRLKQLFDNHGDVTSGYIFQSYLKDRRALPDTLAKLATPVGAVAISKVERNIDKELDLFDEINSHIADPLKGRHAQYAQFVADIKKGIIYEQAGKLTLSSQKIIKLYEDIDLSLPEESIATITSAQLRSILRALQNPKDPANKPIPIIPTDLEMGQAKLPLTVTSQTQDRKDGSFFIVTLTTEYQGKYLFYTAQFEYKLSETTARIVRRIEKDGSLERELLKAKSAFTREVIP